MIYAKAKGDSWKWQNSVSPQTARKIGLSRSRSADLSSAGLKAEEAAVAGAIRGAKRRAAVKLGPSDTVAMLELTAGGVALTQVSLAFGRATKGALAGKPVVFPRATVDACSLVMKLMRRYRAPR